jgi:MFS transporter, DHA2 family, glioxin efflux transporter
MAVPHEKTTKSIEEADPQSSPAGALSNPDAKATSDSDEANPEKPAHGVAEDNYPRGLNFVLLAGASIVAVFLIALDQVRSPREYLQ